MDSTPNYAYTGPMALTGSKTYDYPTTADNLRLNMMVRLPGFPNRLVKVEASYYNADNTQRYIRFDNGNPGQFYPLTEPFTVVSDN